MRFFALALILSAASAVGSTAHAMQCRGRLVSRGDAPSRVRSLCGDPSDVSTRVVQRSRTIHRRLPDGSIVSDTVTVSVEVQEWTYDFGPQRFVRVLTFEDGELVAIETRGYGTPGNSPPPDRPDD
ncbi:MAG TPA: DUF2845 domain-containing protein [Sandaracinaceae bacterium LLY-WYZ-13_1]|nr:DUF2845 domain-containing protein [Sandaracinaceae bacterium LLY-WYZ-13_1]